MIIILILCPMKSVSAAEKSYPSILENERIVLNHLNSKYSINDMNNSFLEQGKDSIGGGGITPFVFGSTTTVNAPNGGDWTYSFGGPTSTTYNYAIKYKKIVYLTNTDLAHILASNFTTSELDDYLDFFKGTGAAGAVLTAMTKGLSLPTKVAILKYIAIAEAALSVVDFANAYKKNVFKNAYNSGNGLIVEYYQYTYNGYWYDSIIYTTWTGYPASPIPGSSYGFGVFHDSIGWHQINSEWYWYENGQAITSAWREINGYWYYLKSNGVMATGWQSIGGKWYYFWDGGGMAKSWVSVSGVWYYLDPMNGDMKTGWQQISGTWYYFYSSGAMATNVTIDGWWIDGNGVAHQP